MRAQIDKELALFEAWIAENPSSQLFFRLAEIYCDLQRTQDAINLVEKALNFHPQHIPARLLLADMYQANEQPEKALNQLKEAALIVSGNADVFSRLAGFMPASEDKLNKLAAELRDMAGLLGQAKPEQLPPQQLQKVLDKLESLRQAAAIRGAG